MINIDISGSLPVLPDLSEVMQNFATNRLGPDIRNDVAIGGNPTWPDRVHPPGKANLAYVDRTLQLSSGSNFARASFGNGLPFAMVHEMGTTIHRTPQMRKFFWAKWYETKDDFWKGMALSKKDIVIPARPVVSGIYNRKEQYAKQIGHDLTITHSVPIAKG